MSESAASPAEPVILHIWPKTDDLLSLDPTCISALLYLQLTIPDKFTVNYSHNPDHSPSGRSVIIQKLWRQILILMNCAVDRTVTVS